MKKLLLLTFTSFIFQTQIAKADLKFEIAELARQIYHEANYSTSSSENLLIIRNQLQNSLNSLRGYSNSFYSTDCFDFAYDAYFKSYTSGPSTDMARSACKKVVEKSIDINVLKYAYEKYAESYTSGPAFDMALSKSLQFTNIDVLCLQKLYDGYFKSYTSGPSMDMAFDACK
ncbi:MAG: hypothetical protein ACOYOK_16065 [Pseudobdellovibrionaceae bacterium]